MNKSSLAVCFKYWTLALPSHSIGKCTKQDHVMPGLVFTNGGRRFANYVLKTFFEPVSRLTTTTAMKTMAVR